MNSYNIIENELARLHNLVTSEGPNRRWAKEKIDEIHVDLFNLEIVQENVEDIESELPTCPEDLVE